MALINGYIAKRYFSFEISVQLPPHKEIHIIRIICLRNSFRADIGVAYHFISCFKKNTQLHSVKLGQRALIVYTNVWFCEVS